MASSHHTITRCMETGSASGDQASNDRFRLHRFDIARVTTGMKALIIGRRATGKSRLVKDILQHNRTIPIKVAISPTERWNPEIGKEFPDVHFYDEYTPTISAKFVEMQETASKMLRKDEATSGRINPRGLDPRAIMVMEDCLYDTSWTKDKNMIKLFMNGRHYKSTLLITMQYQLDIPPALRKNIDFMFVLRETNATSLKRIYDNANVSCSYESFCHLIDIYTREYGCLVIDNTTTRSKFEDRVFWYRANDAGSVESAEMHHASKKRRVDDGKD